MSSQQNEEISQNISQGSGVVEDAPAMTSEAVNVESQTNNRPAINISSSNADSSSSDSDSSSSDSDSSSSDGNSSSDSENSTSSDSDDSVKDISSATQQEKTERKNRKPYYKPEVWPDETVGEYYGLNPNMKLPDIASLSLNKEEKFVIMGHIESIIDRIVSVAPLPNLPVFDLDTLLFLEEGENVLGNVIDVIGEISNPLYVLPLSRSVEGSGHPKIEIGKEVYYAPNSSLTKCVNVAALLMERGCDASGERDIEIPPELRQDFSNDEEEEEFLKKQQKLKNRKVEKAKQFKYNSTKSKPPQRYNQIRKSQYRDSTSRYINPANHRVMLPFDPALPPPTYVIPQTHPFLPQPILSRRPPNPSFSLPSPFLPPPNLPCRPPNPSLSLPNPPPPLFNPALPPPYLSHPPPNPAFPPPNLSHPPTNPVYPAPNPAPSLPNNSFLNSIPLPNETFPRRKQP